MFVGEVLRVKELELHFGFWSRGNLVSAAIEREFPYMYEILTKYIVFQKKRKMLRQTEPYNYNKVVALWVTWTRNSSRLLVTI